jgi:hypothetical protein
VETLKLKVEEHKDRAMMVGGAVERLRQRVKDHDLAAEKDLTSKMCEAAGRQLVEAEDEAELAVNAAVVRLELARARSTIARHIFDAVRREEVEARQAAMAEAAMREAQAWAERQAREQPVPQHVPADILLGGPGCR